MTQPQPAHTALFAHTLTMKGKRFTRLFAMLLIGVGFIAAIASPAAAGIAPAHSNATEHVGIPSPVDRVSIDGKQSANSDTPAPDSETGDRPNHGASNDPQTGDSDSQPAPGGSGIDGDRYSGVNYDWSITWDSDFWNAPADSEDNSNGVDYFELASTRQHGAPPMMAAFETTGIYDGDLSACAEGAEYWVAQDAPGSISNIKEADVQLPDAPRDSSAAAFTYTYSASDGNSVELLGAQVCLPLDDDGAILQVRLVTSVSNYPEARGYFEDLIAAINID